MKADIRFEDGTIVELSQETTDKLRAELVRDVEQLKVDRFRAVKEGTCIRIAIMSYNDDVDDDWDGDIYEDGNALVTHLLTSKEVREIIKGLKRLMGD